MRVTSDDEPKKSSAHHQFRQDNGRALIRHDGPRIIVEIVKVDDSWIDEVCGYREDLLEVGEKRWVVES